MLKLSKLTDYAVVIMAQLAREPQRLYTTKALADELGLPRPTVSKLLKMLIKAELLVSQRGVQGGYQLAKGLYGVILCFVYVCTVLFKISCYAG